MAARGPWRHAQVVLPDLDPGPFHPEDDDRLDGVAVSGAVWAGAAARVGLIECALTGCRLDGALPSGRWSSVVVRDLASASWDLAGTTWSDVELHGGRVGALSAGGGSWSSVLLAGVRLDYLNLRGATLAGVVLADCSVGELDLAGARVTDLVCTGSTVGRLVLHGAALDRVDLRGLALDGVDGVAGLAGATVTPEQLARLAPLLADHLGVTVTD